ncbi:hypothetical protein [Chryseobacterium sp. T1]
MKKITQINQYLLEKYPSLWNTKIVWMLLSAIFIHILFFAIGFSSHQNPQTLQQTNAVDDYFRNGLIYINLIISLLMVVGWLILMFKNNAFKNFYPQSKFQLFFQFVQYFVIIFACITFYFSYMFGFKLFISQKYNDEKMVKDIELINTVAPFLSQNTKDYTLDNRLYPKPFFDLYCERNINNIDQSKKYFVYYDQVYQYFSVYSKTSEKRDKDGDFIIPEPENTNKTAIAYTQSGENSMIYYFKKEVIDLSPYIKTTALSYYNFSKVFYDYGDQSNYRYPNYQSNYSDEELITKKAEARVNKNLTELLDRKNPAEIEKLLNDFLVVSKDLKIKNNLEAKAWAKMIYHPDLFEVKYFIKKYLPLPSEEYDANSVNYDENAYAEAAVDAAAMDYSGNVVNADVIIQNLNPSVEKELSPENYFKKNLTNQYYFSDQLKNLLVNVDTIKTYDYMSNSIHISIWIAFALAIVIFSFRIMGLRSLLFSIISVGVLILVIVLIGLISRMVYARFSEFHMMYLMLLIGLTILLFPLLIMKNIGKFVSSIFMTISMTGFALFVFLIFGIINQHEKANCADVVDVNGNYVSCVTVFDTLGAANISWIILLISLVFMWIYTSVLHKWKALPE